MSGGIKMELVKLNVNVDVQTMNDIDFFANYHGFDRSNATRFLIKRALRTLPEHWDDGAKYDEMIENQEIQSNFVRKGIKGELEG
jgi:hypothetical protein